MADKHSLAKHIRRVSPGLPPLKWSSLMYGFLPGGGFQDVDQEAQT